MRTVSWYGAERTDACNPRVVVWRAEGGLAACWVPHLHSAQASAVHSPHTLSSHHACAGAAIDAVNGDGDVSKIESVSRCVLLSTAPHRHARLPGVRAGRQTCNGMQQIGRRIPCCIPVMLRLLMLRLPMLSRTDSLFPPAASFLLLPTAGLRTLLPRLMRLASPCA